MISNSRRYPLRRRRPPLRLCVVLDRDDEMPYYESKRVPIIDLTTDSADLEASCESSESDMSDSESETGSMADFIVGDYVQAREDEDYVDELLSTVSYDSENDGDASDISCTTQVEVQDNPENSAVLEIEMSD